MVRTLKLTLAALIAALFATIAMIPSGTSADPVDRGCGGGGGKLTKSQIKCVVSKAGWSGNDVAIAAAIAKAESRGDAHAKSFDGAHGRGLFQIDDRYWKISKKCVFNASCNANYAHDRIYSSGGFKMWAAYNNKMYCKFLPIPFKKHHEKRC